MSYTNKVVLITGASSGIGAATAISFAKEGANVSIVGRKEDKLKNVAEKCAQYGVTVLQIIADVSKDDDVTRIIKETIDRFGRLDVLVNNAGIARFGTIMSGTVMNTYDAVTNTNVRAAVHITSLAAPHLVESKGNVVNISAVGGTSAPAPPFLAYCMSKAALNHFTKGAALEFAAAGVRVNAISPGPVRTDIIENSGFPITWEQFGEKTALGRVSEPEEIADLVLFLCSEKAKGITGSNFVSDNGYLLKANL